MRDGEIGIMHLRPCDLVDDALMITSASTLYRLRARWSQRPSLRPCASTPERHACGTRSGTRGARSSVSEGSCKVSGCASGGWAGKLTFSPTCGMLSFARS